MTKRDTEWRRWPLVLAAGMGYGTSTLHTTSLGAMVKPLSAAFGWTRGEITAGLFFLALFGVFYYPVGRLIDRIGSRKVALGGVTIYALALGAVGLTGPSLWTWYVAWAAVSLGICFIATHVWATPVVGSFSRNRGLALGLMLCGSGLTNTFIPTLAVTATGAFGWRGAYFVLGGLALLVTLPIIFLFFKDPRAAKTSSVEPAVPAAVLSGMTFGEAVRTPQFWKLCIAICVAGGVTTAMQVHLQPMFIDSGVSPVNAAWMVSMLGPMLIFGRFGVGFLLDRVPGPLVASVALALPVVSMLLVLNYDGTVWKGVLASALIGLSFGAEVDLIAYLSSRYFGLKNYATIYGTLLWPLIVGLGVTPLIVGYAFDRLGLYTLLLSIMIAVSLLAAATIATLGRYPAAWEEDPAH